MRVRLWFGVRLWFFLNLLGDNRIEDCLSIDSTVGVAWLNLDLLCVVFGFELFLNDFIVVLFFGWLRLFYWFVIDLWWNVERLWLGVIEASFILEDGGDWLGVPVLGIGQVIADWLFRLSISNGRFVVMVLTRKFTEVWNFIWVWNWLEVL